MTFAEALAKSETPTPDSDGFWYLHRTSRDGDHLYLAEDGSYRWCDGVYMEGRPTDAQIMAWPLVTEEDFAATDWDCWQFVF
jgi:hypothetical protein